VGHRYHLVAHSIEIEPDEARRHRSRLEDAAMQLEDAQPDGGVTRLRIPLICARGGSLCRTVADCASHPDMKCRLEQDRPYGTCGLSDH